MHYEPPARTPFDVAAYGRSARQGPCFICALLDGHPGYRHHAVYEDDDTIAFLARYPHVAGCLPDRAEAASCTSSVVPSSDTSRPALATR